MHLPEDGLDEFQAFAVGMFLRPAAEAKWALLGFQPPKLRAAESASAAEGPPSTDLTQIGIVP
jgi:hypothetical protein